MKVKCTCGKVYNVRKEWVGKAVRCPHCSSNIIVPGHEPAPQATMPMAAKTIATPPPASKQQVRAASESKSVTQWVSAPVPESDPKDRAQREQQLISQYVPYMPKPGDRLRGADLAKANLGVARRKRKPFALKLLGAGVLIAIVAVFAFVQVAPLDSGAVDPEKANWILYMLHSIGGKWVAAIGLGVIALGCLLTGIAYWLSASGSKKAV